MRIISGSKRGHRLVEWEESGIRPMRDFVRSALFNILGDLVADSHFLDLFCGTGSVGLEALSRGAAEVTFVDKSPGACGIVRRNLDLLGFVDQGNVLQRDYAEGIDHLERRGRRYELIFLGPPYDKGLADSALRIMVEHPILTADGLIVSEVRNKTRLDERYGPLERVDRRIYGDNVLDFYALERAGDRRRMRRKAMRRKSESDSKEEDNSRNER